MPTCSNKPIPPVDTDFRGDLTPIFDDWTSLYAATDEMVDEAEFEAAVPADKQRFGARHRGRPDLLLRHQVLRAR